jgi:hypothetical protein
MAKHEDFGHKFDNKDSIHETSDDHHQHDHNDKKANDEEGKLLK